LAEWAQAIGPEEVVMESTGIYWKSPYAALEHVGIYAKVVNARHVRNVPGRTIPSGWRHHRSCSQTLADTLLHDQWRRLLPGFDRRL